MDLYKIVKGNSFILHIEMQKANISQNKQMLEDLDVTKIDGLGIFLSDMFGEDIQIGRKPSNLYIQESDAIRLCGNEISVRFPSFLNEGIYGITIRGKYNGNDICSIEKKLFRIIERNGKSHIPLGVVEGEQGGLYNAKYWIELKNFSTDYLYYGALCTFNARNVNIAELSKIQDIQENNEVTICTTKDNPFIWFVSKVPLIFTQAGLQAELTHTEIGEYQYYCTDELVPDEFTYNIKKR